MYNICIKCVLFMANAEISQYRDNPATIPPHLTSDIYVTLSNGAHQVIYGLKPEHFTQIQHRNEEPSAVSYPEYRVRCLEVIPHLQPFEMIHPAVAERLEIELTLLSNKKLNPTAMSVRQRDKLPIAPIMYPGKSANIDYTGISKVTNTHTDFKDENDRLIRMYNNIAFGKDDTRGKSDVLHTTTIQRLYRNGFTVFWAPLRNQSLHVRICDNEIIHTMNQGYEPTDEQYFASSERFIELWHSHY